jgi:hypothetical protein
VGETLIATASVLACRRRRLRVGPKLVTFYTRQEGWERALFVIEVDGLTLPYQYPSAHDCPFLATTAFLIGETDRPISEASSRLCLRHMASALPVCGDRSIADRNPSHRRGGFRKAGTAKKPHQRLDLLPDVL